MVFVWFLLFSLRMNKEAAWVGQKGCVVWKMCCFVGVGKAEKPINLGH